MRSCQCRLRGSYHIETQKGLENNNSQPASLNKLDVHNWMLDVESQFSEQDIVEVRFKNTHKGYYKNVNRLPLKKGDVVAVEANPGHDVGVVSLTGFLVLEQIKKYHPPKQDFKKIYRIAKLLDIEKWEKARSLEESTMIRSRVLAADLGLNMKIGDVEYQGDNTKAIFYYIADERVDFRQLIKILAEEFRIRVEMKQIGARQEAGRIGGIGSCGMELCCSKWLTNFSSVSTNAARLQELSLNPQKLAGQCGKLKCCMNYELDVYKDARKQFPDTRIVLETDDGSAYFQKSDVLQGIMWYSFNQHSAVNLTPLSIDRVNEIISINKSGKKVSSLLDGSAVETVDKPDYDNIVGQDSLTRFDKPKKHRNNRKGRFNKNRNRKHVAKNKPSENKKK